MGKRIEWIDIAKGISIILVVLGHTSFSGPVAIWLKSFRMPFFFAVSGLLFNNSKYPHISDFLQRRTNTIIRPYIIFSLIVFLWDILLGDPIGLSYSQLYTGWISYALWFIPVLMITQILYYYICKLCKNKPLYVLVVLILSAILGYLLYINNIHFYFKLETVFTTVFFYGISHIFKARLLSFVGAAKYLRTTLILGGSFIISFVAAKYNTSTLDICFNNIGNPLFSYTAAISGTIFMLCFSRLLTAVNKPIFITIRNFISYIGKNSYIVLAFHQIIAVTLILVFKDLNMPAYLSSIIRHSLMWLLLLLMMGIINRYAPWLLGKEKAK